MYKMQDWQRLASQHSLHWVIIDQCSAGLVDQKTQRPIKKPTEFWASDEVLLHHLKSMKCRCTTAHSVLEGTEGGIPRTHQARVWPWALASGIAAGVSALIRRQYSKPQDRATTPRYLCRDSRRTRSQSFGRRRTSSSSRPEGKKQS